ncbi:MAG: hypothetical protein DRO18_05370 [Thermoprotei archaeon]|nr:MAG: hypothetical protein DRO18_05370 [Thermoprotei archaeon]
MSDYVLITGASGFLGSYIAIELGLRGHNLILHFNRNELRIKEVMREVLSRHKVDIVTVKADLSSYEGIYTLIRRVKNYELKALINSAAIYSEKPFNEVTHEDWERILRVNLVAPFILSKELGQLMSEEGGVIINISCLTGIYGFNVYRCLRPSIPYIVSKVSLNILTKYLAQVLGPKVRVVGIAPGWIERLEVRTNKVLSKCIEETVILGRAAKVDEVTKLIADIVEGGLSYVNGSVIEVSGGLRMY